MLPSNMVPVKPLASLLVSTLFIAASAEAKPLRVFVLAGPSNLEGHAKIETFDYIGDDPATAPLLSCSLGRPSWTRGVLSTLSFHKRDQPTLNSRAYS